MAEPLKKTYDPACYELAEHFMQDEPCRNDPELFKENCHQLAMWIQESVETWFVSDEDDDIPPDAEHPANYRKAFAR